MRRVVTRMQLAWQNHARRSLCKSRVELWKRLSVANMAAAAAFDGDDNLVRDAFLAAGRAANARALLWLELLGP